MKIKYLIFLMLFALEVPSFAQNKVVKYVTIITGGFTLEALRVSISMGKVDSLFAFKDPNIKLKLQKVSNFRNLADVLNYMSSIGWTFISSSPTYYIFKREFDPSELSTTVNQ